MISVCFKKKKNFELILRSNKLEEGRNNKRTEEKHVQCKKNLRNTQAEIID